LLSGVLLQDSVYWSLEELRFQIQEYFWMKADAVLSTGTKIFADTDDGAILMDQAPMVWLTKSHGRLAFDIEGLADPGHCQARDFYVDDGDELFDDEKDVPLFSDDDEDDMTFYRAAWNYFLAESDGSQGVHNPSFIQDAVQNAGVALQILMME